MAPRKKTASPVRVSDSLSTFTNRIPSAYVDKYEWGIMDIGRWRKYYQDHVLAREAIDRIPEDCFRKGYTWGGATPEQLNLLAETERRLNLRDVLQRAVTFSRLDGEAYIYMDDGTPADQPMLLERVRRDGLRFVNMLRVTDLVKGPLDIDPISQYYMQPLWYQVIASGGDMVTIHPSRMARFIRNPDPNNGLGTSDLALLWHPITWLERAEENVSELTTEARIDVMGVEGLMDAVSDPVEEEAIIKRYALLSSLKRTNKMIVKDLTKEDYTQKQSSFSGLPEIVEVYRRGYCAAIRVPYALVYGRAGGLGSNGEVDIITYHETIASIQRNEIGVACYALFEAVIRSALGVRPDEIFIDWLPLHEVSETEKVDNANKIADAVKKLVESKAIPEGILTKPTVNWLVEINAFPGIEQEHNEWEEGGGELDVDTEEDVIRQTEEEAEEEGPSPRPVADEERKTWLKDKLDAILNRRTAR